MSDFSVVVCTRDRPEQLARTLDALRAGGFPLVVVDQSESPHAGGEGVEVVHDRGRGLSRARNVGLRHVRSEWVVYVDDDCVVASDWAASLDEVLDAHPDVALVSGDVPEAGQPPDGDYVPASAFHVDRERLRRGRFTHPGLVAFGVCFAVRRAVAERLGGWDERLGPGGHAALLAKTA